MLYNEFRPKRFNDVVGQGHITEILRNQVKAKNVAHAYLFNGPKGTGKTTLSKILAKAVNCLHPKNGEPCNECEMCRKIDSGSCLDVIEMDAASKRKIEDMRNIISSLNYPTTESKFRVIILDEVHMLTQEAVNAFLKTLEEPPKNTIFILATTDPQKLPPTILSRCQRYNFRRVSLNNTFKRLKHVAIKSSIDIDDTSLQLISKVADGGMRDALSILDQVKDLDEISYKNIAELLGTSCNENMFVLSKDIFRKNIPHGLSLINNMDESGVDFNVFIKDYVRFLRNILMSKVMGKESSLVIAMTEENISRLLKMECSKEDVISVIELFQKIDTRDRVSLELAVIKSTSILKGKAESIAQRSKQLENNKTNVDTPIKETHYIENSNSQNSDFNEKKERISQAKKTMISKFASCNNYYKNLGQALTISTVKLVISDDKNISLIIIPRDNANKKILMSGYKWIVQGFCKFSKIADMKINIHGGNLNE